MTRVLSRRLGIIGLVLVLCLGSLVPPSFAGSLKQDLDGNLNNKDLDGFFVKGWLYHNEKREFIVYVKDGNKWIMERMRHPYFPQILAIVTSVDFIFTDDSVPSPRNYIFKDGSRELFQVDPDKIKEVLKDAQMSQ